MQDWIVTLNTQNNVLQLFDELNAIVVSNNIESNLEGKSSTGENIKQYDIFNFCKDNNFIGLKNDIRKGLIDAKKINPEEKLDMLAAWAVAGQFDSFHTMHSHSSNASHIATVTYLDLPVCSPHKPGTFYALVNNKIIHIDPVVGDVLIFPARIFHGTYPQSDGLRLTLNLDFCLI